MRATKAKPVTTSPMPDWRARPFLGLQECADLLGVSYATTNTMARQGNLPGAVRVGDQWRVTTRLLLVHYGLLEDAVA